MQTNYRGKKQWDLTDEVKIWEIVQFWTLKHPQISRRRVLTVQHLNEWIERVDWHKKRWNTETLKITQIK